MVQGIAQGIDGIDPRSAVRIDLTTPEVRQQPLRTSEGDLLVVAVPVYMGRVPALLSEWLHRIEARRTPAVGVVVYGNRAYENALLELTDLLTERGCVPVAGAAFLGEHSFSSPELPIAQGRPDAADLKRAEELGRRVHQTLLSAASVGDLSAPAIAGSRPYEGRTELWNVDFIAVSDECTQCGICAEACPVGAIDPDDSHRIDIETCITCCACIKGCPQGAKTMKPSQVKDAAVRLNTFCGDRKEPELFV